jgi:predicted component of type VI protein secretion system
MEVRFVVLSPSGKNRVVPMRLPVLVGRGDEAKFRIKTDSVSRRHCEFFVKGDVVHVRDLGSTNGTLIAVEQIPASVATPVPPGTVVNVGGVFIRVEYESAAVQPAAQPDGAETRPLAVEPGADPAAEPAGSIDPFEPAAEEEPAEPAAEDIAWQPEADAASPPADDENLNDFFKSLS